MATCSDTSVPSNQGAHQQGAGTTNTSLKWQQRTVPRRLPRHFLCHHELQSRLRFAKSDIAQTNYAITKRIKPPRTQVATMTTATSNNCCPRLNGFWGPYALEGLPFICAISLTIVVKPTRCDACAHLYTRPA
eukprot:2899409-Amphidinium_carterae.1